MEDRRSTAYGGGNSSCVPSSQAEPRRSLFAERERVKEQVEFASLGAWMRNVGGTCTTDGRGERTDPIYEELCLVIAEVNVLHPDSAIKVAGMETTVGIVQEVYERLRADHLRTVVGNYQRVSWNINHKKTYLRTALYNVIFEFEAGIANQVAQDFPSLFAEEGAGA